MSKDEDKNSGVQTYAFRIIADDGMLRFSREVISKARLHPF
jgi:hypothetical protein